MIDVVYNYFDVIYRSRTNSPFSIKKSDKNDKLITNLLRRFEKVYTGQIDEDFLWDYIVFQFEFYDDLKTRYEVQLNWIVGDKAINRFVNRNEYWNHWNKVFCDKYGIVKPESKYVVNKEGREEYQNRERKRFYDTERGLIHCIENELYDYTSELCLKCKFKATCDVRKL